MVVLASQKDKNEFAVEIDAKGKLESHFVTISMKLMIHSEKIESGITMNFNIGILGLPTPHPAPFNFALCIA